MNLKAKSFPKLQFFLILFIFVLISCNSEPENIIDTAQFIEIYSRLLIIHEMDINKEYHDRLLEELFEKYTVNAAEIDSTVNYLNSQPEEWLDILSKVRDRIKEIKTEATPKAKKTTDPDKKVPKTQEIRKNDKNDKRRINEQLRQQMKQQKESLRDQR